MYIMTHFLDTYILYKLHKYFKVSIQLKVTIIFTLLSSVIVSAQNKEDSIRIYFHQGKTGIDTCLYGNGQRLHQIYQRFSTDRPDSSSSTAISKIVVIGGASPEGSIRLNRWLSEQRAQRLFDYICHHYYSLPDTLRTSVFLGRDWKGLYHLAEKDVNIPYREETLETLRSIIAEVDGGGSGENEMQALRRLRAGASYNYMYRNLFPRLRSSVLHVYYKDTHKPLPPMDKFRIYKPEFPPLRVPRITRLNTIPSKKEKTSEETSSPGEKESARPFYMDIKSNMLYDALLVPNIGVEFYLGRNWSVAGNWMYAWWKSDRLHDYWRTYGGDVEIRRWLGKKAGEKPLTGHHIGVYGQIVTYDFELGGQGFLGDKWSYGAGVSYGYSRPVARRLNIDFTLGIGCLRGQYKRYLPIDTHYVWQSTHNGNWIIPTKAEISLIWLVGRENFNRKFCREYCRKFYKKKGGRL